MWFFTIKCDVNCRFYFADVFFFSFSLDSLFQGEKFPSDPSLLRVVTMDGVELCQILFVHLLRLRWCHAARSREMQSSSQKA